MVWPKNSKLIIVLKSYFLKKLFHILHTHLSFRNYLFFSTFFFGKQLYPQNPFLTQTLFWGDGTKMNNRLNEGGVLCRTRHLLPGPHVYLTSSFITDHFRRLIVLRNYTRQSNNDALKKPLKNTSEENKIQKDHKPFKTIGFLFICENPPFCYMWWPGVENHQVFFPRFSLHLSFSFFLKISSQRKTVKTK